MVAITRFQAGRLTLRRGLVPRPHLHFSGRHTMDDETRAAFTTLMTRMNDQHERLLDMMASLRDDFANTKSFLIGDSLVVGRRVRGIEDRLDDLEKRLP